MRQSLVVLQAMFEQAIRWGWVATNPVKAVRKPVAKRERAVLCLAPSQVEAIRQVCGQKVRGFHPRAIDLLDPGARAMLAHGIREGLLFARRDGQPWRLHDYQNWRRRTWHSARE